jgi:hypothetical protein
MAIASWFSTSQYNSEIEKITIKILSLRSYTVELRSYGMLQQLAEGRDHSVAEMWELAESIPPCDEYHQARVLKDVLFRQKLSIVLLSFLAARDTKKWY